MCGLSGIHTGQDTSSRGSACRHDVKQGWGVSQGMGWAVRYVWVRLRAWHVGQGLGFTRWAGVCVWMSVVHQAGAGGMRKGWGMPNEVVAVWGTSRRAGQAMGRRPGSLCTGGGAVW